MVLTSQGEVSRYISGVDPLIADLTLFIPSVICTTYSLCASTYQPGWNLVVILVAWLFFEEFRPQCDWLFVRTPGGDFVAKVSTA